MSLPSIHTDASSCRIHKVCYRFLGKNALNEPCHEDGSMHQMAPLHSEGSTQFHYFRRQKAAGVSPGLSSAVSVLHENETGTERRCLTLVGACVYYQCERTSANRRQERHYMMEWEGGCQQQQPVSASLHLQAGFPRYSSLFSVWIVSILDKLLPELGEKMKSSISCLPHLEEIIKLPINKNKTSLKNVFSFFPHHLNPVSSGAHPSTLLNVDLTLKTGICMHACSTQGWSPEPAARWRVLITSRSSFSGVRRYVSLQISGPSVSREGFERRAEICSSASFSAPLDVRAEVTVHSEGKRTPVAPHAE